jgi:hypothetical protein
MVKARAEVTINRSADDVWARVRDWSDVTWIPPERSCKVEGDLRTVVVPGVDMVLVQQLVHHDDAERTYSYTLPAPLDLQRVLGPGRMVHLLDGTLKVAPQGDDAAFVTYEVDTEDWLVASTHEEYQRGLDTLKAELEGDAAPR